MWVCVILSVCVFKNHVLSFPPCPSPFLLLDSLLERTQCGLSEHKGRKRHIFGVMISPILYVVIGGSLLNSSLGRCSQ